jgi:type I restriction enzyme, R subunit
LRHPLFAVDILGNPYTAQLVDKPHTGIAFLVVCDMLLTGFDAPIEQVMYIDKKSKSIPCCKRSPALTE